jgi:regulatory protein
MPTITKITPQRRRVNRRNIFLDGAFAFGVNLNVVARFRLREGMTITAEQVAEIERGEVRQEAFDKATEYLARRLHSRAELQRKLMGREYGPVIVEAVLDDLQRLGYIDDTKFATAKALSAAQHKQHGRRRAAQELLKAGVKQATARRALEDVYDSHDSLAVARQLAQKQSSRLRKLDPIVARRRLAGMLLRRGFSYDEVRPVIDEVLGDENVDE